MSNRNRAILFSRVEGGVFQPMTEEVYEDEVKEMTGIIKKDVHSKTLNRKLTTRVIKIGKNYVHALFFEDGNAYDCTATGFEERKDYKGEDTKELFNRIYREKTNAS